MVWLRRLSQTAFFLLFVYILWSTTYPLTGGISPNLIFSLDPLVVFVTALSERAVLSGMGLAAAMLALTFVLGRFFCGWVCPLGFCIDLGARLGASRRRNFTRFIRARRSKYYLLGFLGVLAILGFQWAWFLDPVVIAARFVSLNLIPLTVKASDKFLAFLLKTFGLYGAPLDFYRWLKEGALGVNAHVFTHSIFILVIFAAIVLAAEFHRRFWCRLLCPLGALYALVARFSLLRRVVRGCISCGNCRENCRMTAIADGASYDPAECILCMDCIYDCAAAETRFSFLRPPVEKPEEERGISRREFLSLAGAALPAASLGATPAAEARPLIRPPGALPEDSFLDRCIRCGNCMKVCLTNGLQPVMFESGLRGIWTPRLVPAVGYCEYNCNLCGKVCPVGAIADLPPPKKKKFKMGQAFIDRELCLPWKKEQECLVCEEHCPVPEKAIKLNPVPGKGKLKRPCLDEELCTGCGICENKCPLRPQRAIRVYPPGAELPEQEACLAKSHAAH